MKRINSRVGRIVFSLLVIAIVMWLYQVFLLAKVKPKKLTVFDDINNIVLLRTLGGMRVL